MFSAASCSARISRMDAQSASVAFSAAKPTKPDSSTFRNSMRDSACCMKAEVDRYSALIRATGDGSSTTAPIFGFTLINWRDSRDLMASRTHVLLTESSSVSCFSVGSRSPGFTCPFLIILRM